jgi:hypothetical protein
MVLNHEKEEQGVSLVSFVENPAIQRPFLALSEVKIGGKVGQKVAFSADSAQIKLATSPQNGAKRVHFSADDAAPASRQILTGAVLVPDEEILRVDEEGNPYFISFDEATIVDISRRYAAAGRQTASNHEHDVALTGNVFGESWLVVDSERDKSAALGLTEKPGTWMLSAYIPDTTYWEENVVTGKVTGFSLEGIFDLAKLTLAAPAPKPMRKPWNFSLLAGLAKLAGVKFTKVELKDGTIIDVAEDGTVSDLDEDGKITGPKADGEYELADGTKINVKGGKKEAPVAAAEETEKEPGQGEAKPGDVAEVLKVLKAAEGETDAAKLLEAIKKAIEAAGGTAEAAEGGDEAKLKAVALSLKAFAFEAVEMEGGKTFQYNPITRRLLDETGQMVQSGDFACADGSCFRVNTEQYTYQISKEDFAKSTEAAATLAEVQQKLAAAEVELGRTPSAARVELGNDTPKPPANPEAPKPAGWVAAALSRAAELKARPESE